MRPLTDYIHKSMIPFSGIPLLAYSMATIPQRSKVVIIVNHLADQIAQYFGNSHAGLDITYLKQSDPQGTGDALYQFFEAYRPAESVIVWQADQLMFPEEIDLLAASDANAAIYAQTEAGPRDVGLWKIQPATLQRLRGRFERGEYRALPVLEQEGLQRIPVQRTKLEISFDSWEQIHRVCMTLKQKYLFESR